MSDYIVRAMAADAQIRAFACITKETVETARQAHDCSPVVTAALGRLLSAGAMMGAMLKGEKDVLTLQLKGAGPMRGVTVTADAKGNVKGYPLVPDVYLPANAAGKLDVAGAIVPGILSVIKDMGLKEPYVGQIALESGEIAEDLTYYFATSEQTPSSVGLGVLMEKNNTVKEAGGFIIQLMPFASDEVIDKLEENLSKVSSVTSMLCENESPEHMLELILDGLNPEFMETSPVAFLCDCNKHKVEKVLFSLGRKELKEMIDEGEEIEVNCQFCNSHYKFSVEELKGIYDQQRKYK